MIPILLNHDASKLIGKLEGDIITLREGTDYTAQDICGMGLAIVPTEFAVIEGKVIVKKARLFEFSIDRLDPPFPPEGE
jgi:hypothetical protein